MIKTGASAMLALATLSGVAFAQDTGSECAVLWAHCLGPDPGDNASCCAGTQCVQKNEQYAQCRPLGETAPDGWMGDILGDEDTVEEVTEDDMDMDDDEDSVEAEELTEDDMKLDGDVGEDKPTQMTEDDLIMDAEDMVEMGMVPPGLDTEDLEEAGVKPGMTEADLVDLGIIDSDDDDREEEDEEDADEDDGEEDDDEDADPGLSETTEDKAGSSVIIYRAEIGKDYPKKDGSPAAVSVEDIDGESYVVASPAECEDLCTATSECNAASYYLDGNAYGGSNCWLKKMGNSCELPADHEDDPNAVFLLQLDQSCAGFIDDISAFGPESALGPLGVAESPLLAPFLPEGGASNVTDPSGTTDPELPGVGTGTVTRSIDDSVSDSFVNPDASGVVSLRSALVALAVAGAAAFF